MCKYNSFSRRKSFYLLRKIKHIHLKSIQTAARKGKQGQHEDSPFVTQGMIVRQQRCEGRGKSHSKHCRMCVGEEVMACHVSMLRVLSPCCLARLGNNLKRQSIKTRGDYLASVHI